MNMIDVTLKAKHFRLIAYLLKNIVASDVFRILSEIKDKVLSTYADDDEVTISAYADELIYAYPILSALPEGVAAEMNKDMDYMLRDQIVTGLQGTNASDWQNIYDFVTNHKAAKAAIMTSYINNGKNFLN